jgi:hypothetical protein
LSGLRSSEMSTSETHMSSETAETLRRVSSYSRGAHFELRLPGNRLRCGGCGRPVSAYAFDVIEPGFVRAVCAHCHEDLIAIEMR